MKQRVISAFFGILVLVLVLLGNQYVFDVVVTLISSMAIFEVLNAIDLTKNKRMTAISVALPAALIAFSHFSIEYLYSIVFLFIAFLMIMMLFGKGRYTFNDTAVYIAVSVIFSLSFLHVSFVRRLGNETLDVLVVLIGSWITDTCAYFAGYFFGKHKLAPDISPKKTIEGSIGGIVGVIVIIVAYAYIAGNIMNVSVNIYSAIAAGLIAGVVSQFGDLCASIIKREHNVKDFGNIMPGHGGVMDRFDSLLFVAPALYYLLKFLPIFF